MASRRPAEVFPPGVFVKDEIEERGWSQTDLAEILGRPVGMINELISGKRGVSVETAKGLAAAFGTSPEFWIGLDTAYQLSRSETDDAKEVSQRARLYAKAPIKEMLRRGWLEPSENPDVLESRVLDFFHIASIEDEPMLAHVAKKSTSYVQPPTPAQLAWLFRAQQLAMTIPMEKFSASKVDKAVEELKSHLHDPIEIRHVPRILAAAGVRLVVVQPLTGSKIDGACFWMDKTPVIAMTLRFDRIDNFWFVLLHELGHVHGGEWSLDEDLSVEVDGASKPETERAADEFAMKNLVPADMLDSFIARHRPLFSAPKVSGFAQRAGIHPGIVVGQLQHRKEISYATFRKSLVPVREIVTAATITDGWGAVLPASF